MLSPSTERAMQQNLRECVEAWRTAFCAPLPWPRKNLPYRHEIFSGTIRSQPKHVPVIIGGVSCRHAASALFQTQAKLCMEVVTLTRAHSRILAKIGEGRAAIISGFRNRDGQLIADGIRLLGV